MDTKHLPRVRIKDAAKGEVTAVFATFDAIDSDGDVTRPGAFTDGAEVRISAYGHGSWDGLLPVGKGVMRSTRTEAVLDGQFFLDTAAGADTFAVVRQMGDLQEWSYGYKPVKWSYGEFDGQQVRFLEQLAVYEVSPVLLGAGVNTRTLSTKGATFAGEAEAVLAAVTSLVDRAVDVLAKRQEKGKGLGVDSSTLLGRVEVELTRLSGLLAEVPDVHEELRTQFTREWMRAASSRLT
ncbi:MAG: HK97 family phage prohead protease [Actinobacteria bacterium]|nr:HK97 family phage prohead protease [Actinomycetota bacterium]MBI3687243.1 HK97 family phage prohead protease [Actinomycetota bacterium]